MLTCEMQLGDRVKFVFSPDVILCGGLGSLTLLYNVCGGGCRQADEQGSTG